MMTQNQLTKDLPLDRSAVVSAQEFNLWCSIHSKPYRLIQHAWPDGLVEWDVEYYPGRPHGTVAYGTGQQDEARAVLAGFAFISGVEWAESEKRLREEDDDQDGLDIDRNMDRDRSIAASGDEVLPVEEPSLDPVESARMIDHLFPDLNETETEEIPGVDSKEDREEDDVLILSDEIEDEIELVEDGDISYSDDLYQLPPDDLLPMPPPSSEATVEENVLIQNSRTLETVLKNFGVRGEVMDVRPGPVVTLYEFEPAPGTKSSRIINLADDIARSMSAITARIAVVPGRSMIGIELPNPQRESVYLQEMLVTDAYRQMGGRLPLVLGKDIGGSPVVVDLARMPHLLIAGTTGSGKSVGINTMILSLLYRARPENCRFIMVDPKMLELSVYDGIPHLLTPVVTDPKKAVVAMKWAVREMEDRYKLMSTLGVRNIEGFNQRVAEILVSGEQITRRVQVGFDKATREPVFEEQILDLKKLPYIVIVVDEMADLMLVAGKEIEAAIQRLAQMARAAGIHLIMATQRPSVDVITGTIKANFPTRISFQVTSKIDSRTILGEAGAEQLLGQGDMLYMAAGGRITRVHGAFVSDSEVEKVVNHLKLQGIPDYMHSITEDESDEAAPGADDEEGAMSSGSGDELYDQALALVLRERKISVSFIQRYLQIGYNRSARLVERMQAEGIVSPANHAGKREILASRSSYFQD